MQAASTSTGRRSAVAARRWRWRRVSGFFFVLPWLVGFLLLQLFPFLASLAISFTDWSLAGRIRFVGLANYTALVDDPLLARSVLNTVYYSALHVPGSLVIAFGLAWLLNQKVRGTAFYRTAFYLPAVTSGAATAVIWIWLLNANGIVNNALGLVGVQGPNWFLSSTWALPALVLISYWGVGTTMVLYLAGLQGIPETLYEAAMIDGASAWGQFRHVTLPMMTPLIFLTAVLGILGSFQVFTSALVTTNGGPGHATTFVVMVMYWAGWQFFKMGYASAIGWALLVVLLALTALQFRIARYWVYYEYGPTTDRRAA